MPTEEQPTLDRVATVEELAEIDDVHERFLHAAARVILDDTRGVIERGIRTEDVTDRADRTRRAFYARFPSKVELFDEVLDRFIQPDRNDNFDELIDGIDEIVAQQSGDLARTIAAVASVHYDAVCGADLHILQQVAWTTSDSDYTAGERLRSLYSTYDARLANAFERLLEHWGREYRPPFDGDLAAVVLTALLDGLMVRRRFDGELVPPELFGDVIVALVPALTRSLDDTETIADPLLMVSAEAAARWRESQRSEITNSRRAIIDAAVAELDARGVVGTRLEQVALRAGLSQRAIRAEFQGLDHVLCAAMGEYLGSFRHAVDEDLRNLDLARLEVVKRHLERLATFALARRPLVRAVLASTVTYAERDDYEPSPDEIIDQLAEPLATALQWASNSDEIDLTGSLRTVAVSATEALLFRATRSGDHDVASLVTAALAVTDLDVRNVATE